MQIKKFYQEIETILMGKGTSSLKKKKELIISLFQYWMKFEEFNDKFNDKKYFKIIKRSLPLSDHQIRKEFVEEIAKNLMENPVEFNFRILHIPLIKHLHFIPLKAGYSNHNDWLIGTGLNLEF